VNTVLLISTSYPQSEDGSESAGSFVRDFAVELAQTKKVLVLAPVATDADIIEHADNLQVYRFRGAGKPLSTLSPARPADWPDIMRILYRGRHLAEQIAFEHKVDHIFAFWVLPSGYWAKQAASKVGIDYSTWALGSDIWSLANIPLVKSVLKNVLLDSRRNYADGVRLTKEVEEISKRQCDFLPSTRQIEINASCRSNIRKFRFAFLGRWHPNKGSDLLLQALDMLGDNDWELIEELRFFGGGPQQELVHAELESLRSSGRPVIQGGFVNKDAAADLLAWSDYVILPSRIESIPLIFSDTMKAGKPILATPVGDLPELLHKYQCGLLAESCSAAALSQLIRKALHVQPSTFSEGVKMAARDFSLETIVKRYVSDISQQP